VIKTPKALGVLACLTLAGCDANAPSHADLEHMMQTLPNGEDDTITVHDESCTPVGNALYKCELTYDKRYDTLNLMTGITPGLYASKIAAVVQKGPDRWQIVSDYQMLDRHKIGE
jgi:hypothetical protein